MFGRHQSDLLGFISMGESSISFVLELKLVRYLVLDATSSSVSFRLFMCRCYCLVLG